MRRPKNKTKGTSGIQGETAEGLKYISVFGDTQKFQIAMLLFTYHELNVTQISNMLHQSKATISRHLKEMEGTFVVSREAFREKEIPGRITPKYYRISDEFYRQLKPVGAEQVPGDDKGRIQFFKGFVRLIRSSTDISKECLELYYPLADYLESQSDDPEKAYRAFNEYVFSNDLRLDFCVLGETQYKKFIQYLMEFEKKMVDLMNEPPSGEPQPYFFIGSLLNMGKLLELQGRMRQEKKAQGRNP
jgi:DNA-binding HxlR family transcriptional regulator